MSNITYRAPKVEDAETIVKFYNYVGGETHNLSFEKDEYPMSVEDQIADIKGLEGNVNNMMLLAMDGDEIAGIVTISSSHKIKSRHDGELGIVVAEKYWGQGIGSELIQRSLDWCRGNGVTKRVNLITSSNNYNAIKLYMKFGFIMEGTLKNTQCLDGEYWDSYVMGMML